MLLKIYLSTVAFTLLSEMLVTAKAQFKGFDIMKHQLLCTIICSSLPLANLVVFFSNIQMLFMKNDNFIINYLYIKRSIDEISIKEEEDDRNL